MSAEDFPIPSHYAPIGSKYDNITVTGYKLVDRIVKGKMAKKRVGTYVCECGKEGTFSPSKLVSNCIDCHINKSNFTIYRKG